MKIILGIILKLVTTKDDYFSWLRNYKEGSKQ